MDSNDNQQEQNTALPKPADSNAPTQIIINSEDGSIVNAADVESSASTTQDTPGAPEIDENNVAEKKTEEDSSDLNMDKKVIDQTADSDSTSLSMSSQNTEENSIENGEENQSTPIPETHSEESVDTQAQDNPMAIPPQDIKKSGKSKIPIILAVLITISLVGVAVFAFLSSKDKHEHTADPTDIQQNSQTEDVSEVKTPTEEIDAATKDIDVEIEKTTGDNDIPKEESVNDQTLGL